jgi:hypothetical protein
MVEHLIEHLVQKLAQNRRDNRTTAAIINSSLTDLLHGDR